MEAATDFQAAPSSEAQAAMLAATMFGGAPLPEPQQQQQIFGVDYAQAALAEAQLGAQPQMPMMFPGAPGGTAMGMDMGMGMGMPMGMPMDMNAVGMPGMTGMEGALDPSQTTVSGEVRYDDPAHAQQALNMLDGSLLYGHQITVRMSTTNNPTGTKLVVTGIPLGCGWQELKDHFKNVGTVAFAGLAGDKGKGRGRAMDGAAQMAGMKRGFDGGPMGMAKYARGVGFGMGVVRFQDPVGAQMSLQILGGSEFKGSAIKVDYDTSVGDGTQVIVTGLSDSVTPQDLIEYFSTAGPVASAEVKKSSGPGAGNEAPDQSIGEIRYDHPEHSGIAVASLNGSMLQGATITVIQDPTAPDGNKLQVLGLSPMTQWQELKDHFSQVGAVAYAGVRGGKPEFTTAQFEGMMIPYQGGATAMPMQPQQQQMAYGTGTACALVRFGTAEEATKAVGQLNGMDMQEQGGTTLSVTLDGGSKDGTKIRMRGLPPTTQWQDLKDFCSQLGTIAFCEVAPDNGITATGEIRYANPEHAMVALSNLNGSTIDGAIISVTQDMSSQSGSKLLIMGLSPLTQWQELKDHFGQVGPVAYAGIVGDKGRGKNRMAGMAAAAAAAQGGGCQQYGGGPTYNMGVASAPMGVPMGQPMGQPPMGMLGQPMGGQPMMPAMGQPQGACYGGGGGGGGGYAAAQQRPPRQRRNAPPSIEGRTALAGEVRYEDPAHAQMALNTLNGSQIGGSQIQVQPHKFNNPMGTKILVTGLPLHVGWQELKEHFMQCGHVAFAATR